MLDVRRLGIPGLEGWEVDARCRVFRSGTRKPVDNEWPYVTVDHHDLALSFQVAEAAALAFLGEDGCSEVYRELFSENVRKGHPRTKQIALEKGLSEWIVIAASRRHHSQFRLTVLLQMIRWGQIDESMKLHRVIEGRIDGYVTYPVDNAARTTFAERRNAIHDHVMTIAGQQYRLRQSGHVPMAREGDLVCFSYRLDPKGARYIVRSSFGRLPPAPSLDMDTLGHVPGR